MEIIGDNGEHTRNNGVSCGRSMYGFVTPVMTDTLSIVSGHVWLRGPASTYRMYVYTYVEGSPETGRYVAHTEVVDGSIYDQTLPRWLDFPTWAGGQLEVGNRYLILISSRTYSGGEIPYYSETGSPDMSAVRTPVGSFPDAAWEANNYPDPIGTVQTAGSGLGAGTSPAMYLVVDGSSPRIDSVDGIVDEAETGISGANLKDATVTVGGYPLSVLSINEDGTFLQCAPATAYINTSLPYGDHPLVVTTQSGSATRTVAWSPASNKTLAVGASIDSVYGLAQEGGADGDQWVTFDSISGSNVVLSDDTNLLISPAAIDNASRPYWWYSGGVWVQSSYVINGSGQGFEIWGFAAVTDALGEVTLKGITGTLSGTVYGVVDASPTSPTKEQVRDGLNAAGAPALGKGSASVTTTDLSVTITGLPSDTLLYGWLAQWV